MPCSRTRKRDPVATSPRSQGCSAAEAAIGLPFSPFKGRFVLRTARGRVGLCESMQGGGRPPDRQEGLLGAGMVDFLKMFRRQPAQPKRRGFAREQMDIGSLGGRIGSLLKIPVRDRPARAERV